MRQASRRVVKFPNVEVVHATPRAVLCTIAAVEFWVPRSQIHLSSEVQHPGDVGVLGYDVLRLFRRVCFDFDKGELTLER